MNHEGDALYDQGKYDEAIMAYDKVTEIDPMYAPAWNNKGWIFSTLGKYDEAIEAYDKAIKIDPKYRLALENKDIAIRKKNSVGEANAAIKSYRTLTNYEYGCRIDVPADWLTFMNEKDGLAVGKKGELESLNIVIDQMGVNSSIYAIKQDFFNYVKESGYEIKRTSEINVDGKNHFCALVIIPDSKMLEWGLKDADLFPYDENLPRIKNLLAKKYALMFSKNLYQISCPLGEITDESNYEIYAEKELMYDRIVSTFRILRNE